LDKRKIVIKSRPGEVIKPETLAGQPFVKIVSGEGMPSKGNPFIKGNLYVLFRVEFPEDGDLDDATISTLKKTLPNPMMDLEYDENEVEVCHLDSADVKNFGKGGAAVQEDGYDSDDGDSGPGNVECRQS
jgi:DnaJ family protein A protein 2